MAQTTGHAVPGSWRAVSRGVRAASFVTVALLVASSLAPTACAARTEEIESRMLDTETREIEFTGVIVYQEVSGGFFGIVTDTGARLDPIELPDRFQVDGLAVAGRGVPRPDLDSNRMWGTLIEISSITER